VWAKEHALEQTKFGLDVAQHVLTYYEKFFNIKYPLPKIGTCHRNVSNLT
jgi:aminopeptidase N